MGPTRTHPSRHCAPIARTAVLTLALAVTLAAATAPAVAQQQRYRIEQPAQPLADALLGIARQTGASVLVDAALLQGLRAKPVSGELTAAEAIDRALQGSGLAMEVLRNGTVVVKQTAPPTSPARGQATGQTTSSASAASAGAVMLAQAQVPGASDAGQGADATAPAAAANASAPQKVEITGSRLRRLDSETALPVNVYSRRDIERSGQPTLERFLSGLNEVSVVQGEASFNGATTGQGTVQLRGLALGSTLVLINGRRVQAVGSSGGNFFNLNLIPLAAVERIEVVPVGSSAVYGGDALAGVVNVILRKSMDGTSLSARFTSGAGFGDGSVSLATGGRSGGLDWMVLGSYSKAQPLSRDDRAFFRDADYRRFGGTDARVRNCTPGNVVSNTTANLPGLNSTIAAIPETAAGQPLTVQSFAATAGQPSLCSSASANGAVLIYGDEQLGLHSSAQLLLGETLTAFGELSFVKDKIQGDGLGLSLNNLLVPASNAYNPFGTAVRVSTRLGAENGTEAFTRESDFLRTLAGLRGDIGGGWDFEAAVSVSRDWGQRTNQNLTINTAARTAALASANAATALNPFASGRAASDDVLRGIWSNNQRLNYGRKDIASAFVRGPVFQLPAGSVDALVGAETSRDKYETLLPEGRFDAARRSDAAFGEMRLPLFKAGEGARSWTVAALTLAARGDRYSDFGSAGTYQAGFELRPVPSTLLRASVASSFKPPTLAQTNIVDTVYAIDITNVTDPRRGNERVINGDWVRTANKGLHPEEGKAFAMGALWEPEAGRGPRLGVLAWQVRIDGLISLLDPQVIVDNEGLFPGFVTREPAVNGVPGRITRLQFSEVNFGQVQTSGIDLEAGYSERSAFGRWSVVATATRTSRYDVVIAPRAPEVARVGRRFTEYWAPGWKGRVAGSLDVGAFSLGMTSRYLGSYLDAGTSDRKLGGRWAHDLSARVDLRRLGWGLGPVKAASLSLAVVNVANQQPEYVNASPYFDQTQADWRGRYASLRLSVDW